MPGNSTACTDYRTSNGRFPAILKHAGIEENRQTLLFSGWNLELESYSKLLVYDALSVCGSEVTVALKCGEERQLRLKVDHDCDHPKHHQSLLRESGVLQPQRYWRRKLSSTWTSNVGWRQDIYAHCIHFKLVAEDLERENDFESVEEIRGALLEVVNATNDLEHHRKALSYLEANFQAGAEATNFEKVLSETAAESQRQAAPFDPRTHSCFEQFNQAVWNIHHAGEPAPGQEQDEIVMMGSQYGVKNMNCPLTGKHVTELEEPVRNKDCEHIYEKVAVLRYITDQSRVNPRRRCRCAIAGCPKQVVAANVVCDPALKMIIQELRLKEKVNTEKAPVADFTEGQDDEDEGS
ncbi:hypothetical protein R1flu_019164 [Riccia fluitans]|uniref:SP-RING-type domain-containing protein n=1 Tax=Riccia fluitans TaxID=41844 RepID=A0ABD1ZK45_9MARC